MGLLPWVRDFDGPNFNVETARGDDKLSGAAAAAKRAIVGGGGRANAVLFHIGGGG
jgi:hypothetical protein